MSFHPGRFITALFCSAFATNLLSQVPRSCITPPESAASRYDGSWELAANGYGVSFGGATPIHGLRLGAIDNATPSVDGVNVSVWANGECATGRIRGLAVGVVGPYAGRIDGIAAGGVVRSNVSTNGITAGLATTTGGWQRGITATATFSQSTLGSSGLTLSGIATLSDGRLVGISAAPIAVMGGSTSGLTVAGLFATTEASMSGISIGGLALQPDGDARWVTASGAGTIIGGNATGLSIGGLWLSTGGSMTGVNASGVVLRSGGPVRWISMTPGVLLADGAVDGLSIGGLHIGAQSSRGLMISATNRVTGLQTGVSIGLINDAVELHGLQLGLLNYVRSRHGLTRILPLVQFGR